MNELFSTYRQGENRVTGTFLAVMQNLSVHHFSLVLQQLADLPERPLITIKNQSQSSGRKGSTSVPDAEFSADFDIRIETKLGASSGGTDQVRAHADQTRVRAEHRVVVALGKGVPGDAMSDSGEEDQPKIVEASFEALLQILDDVVLQDPFSSEREKYLVNQFHAFIHSEGLIDVPEVLIVAARHAWKQYQFASSKGGKYSLYTCQPHRSFRNVQRMGFYANSKIQKPIPEIKCVVEELDWNESERKEQIDREKKARSKDEWEMLDEIHRLMTEVAAEYKLADFSTKAMLLSGESHAASLDHPIMHNIPRVAFTYGHRYIAESDLFEVGRSEARTTEDLIERGKS